MKECAQRQGRMSTMEVQLMIRHQKWKVTAGWWPIGDAGVRYFNHCEQDAGNRRRKGTGA